MCTTAYFEQIVHHQRGQLWYAYLYIKQNKCRKKSDAPSGIWTHILLWFNATRVANFRASMSLMLWVNLHVVNSPTKQQVCCGSEDQGNGWLDQTLKIKWTKFMHLFFSHFKATKCLKCIWHEKYFLLIWKAFENTEEWHFSFWNIFFSF